MTPSEVKVELTIRYEPAESGWLTASVPAVPGTISIGRTRTEARTNVIDALAEMLMAVPEDRAPDRRQVERVQLDLSIGRVLEDGLDRGL